MYVQPYPLTGAKWQVSTGGGFFPHWSSDGRELWYRGLADHLAVSVETEGPFNKGVPQPLFPARYQPFDCTYGHDSAVCTSSEQALTRVDVMLNWFGRLGRKER